jgi:hypothetical protein
MAFSGRGPQRQVFVAGVEEKASKDLYEQPLVEPQLMQR